MSFMKWSQSGVNYGRRLVGSAFQGARSGENEFLNQEPLAPFLNESARQAVCPAVIGACLGVLGGCLGNGRRSTARTLACGFIGGAIGFGAGMIWESRDFTACVASGAWKNIDKTRDERWFEKNPIDYA
jgi:hypothetical protein